MAISQKAFDAEVSKWQNRVWDLHKALVTEPDDTRKSGRIAGYEGKYSLRVWYRRTSGTTYAALIHHYPGQTDSVSFDGDLEDMAKMCKYRDTPESVAISDLIHDASQAFRKVMRGEPLAI